MIVGQLLVAFVVGLIIGLIVLRLVIVIRLILWSKLLLDDVSVLIA